MQTPVKIVLSLSLLAILVVLTAARPSEAAKSPTYRPSVDYDLQAAQVAYQYLNQIRQNPGKYNSEIGIDLSKYKAMPALEWNDQLAKAARWKVRDMAEKDYFSHIDKQGYGMNHHINRLGYTLEPDWLKPKRSNNFESIYGATQAMAPKMVIKELIVDAGYKVPGHRIHLLGLDDWNASLTDIGIAFGTSTAKNDRDGIRFFVCVLIAKQTW